MWHSLNSADWNWATAQTRFRIIHFVMMRSKNSILHGQALRLWHRKPVKWANWNG